MACDRRLRLRFVMVAAVLWLSLAAAWSQAAERLAELRNQARKCEKEGDWAKACSFYAYIVSKEPSLVDDRTRFQTCLRHLHRTRRHSDPSYRDQVLSQDFASALKIYGEILTCLQSEYVDGEKAGVNRLFHQGLEELRLALGDEAFRREYLPGVLPELVRSFQQSLTADWGKRVVRYQLDAQSQALQIALAAKKALGLRPTVTVLEIACGACNALDEHTFYLTPRQHADEYAILHGEMVGVGLEVVQSDNKLLISQVLINSPAARAGLSAGDEILRIDNDAARKFTACTATERLKGRAGSRVELEVVSPAGGTVRVSLTRQPFAVRSVADFRIADGMSGIGYVQLVAFHENTLQELNDAIQQLELQGMRSLILDLRGNAGGLFSASVQVSERFLEEGACIVTTRGRARDVKRTSHNLNPLLIPLVVLVDEGTASSAEVVAGALKDNGRATLIGQTTFGKATMQHVVELKTVQAGGLRISWVRFFSPLSRASGEGGVAPHIPVDQPKSMYDEQLAAALNFLANRPQ